MPQTIDVDGIDAVIFDTDGVLTDTASVHAAAWKRLFDAYLEEHARRRGEPFRPFEEEDYRRFVDGKPRYDGVRSFLASRGIRLEDGDPADPPDRESVCGLGNRKNTYFVAHLDDEGARPYDSTVALVRELQAAGVRTAVISASRNMVRVLESAGLAELFDVRVDGTDAERLGLPGKPDPAVFLEAARRLEVPPERTAIIEDALAGVEAGRRGGFALVVGVDRSGQESTLRDAGADVVVSDLSEVRPGRDDRTPLLRDLPSALERLEEIWTELGGRTPAVFLDYDGTLTPIVGRPQDAVLSEHTRRAIEELAARCPVAVVSGRDLDDAREMVGVPGISYAGSHGFDIVAPDGTRHQKGGAHTAVLDAAASSLRSSLGDIPGALVERKRFAIAVHFRQAADDRVPDVAGVVDEVAAAHPELRKTGGKKIFELRPAVDWDKGKALLWLLDVLDLDREDILPFYLGDDETDEDAFRAIRDRGVGIAVRGEDDRRKTAARYQLASPQDVARFLQEMASKVGRGAP